MTISLQYLQKHKFINSPKQQILWIHKLRGLFISSTERAFSSFNFKAKNATYSKSLYTKYEENLNALFICERDMKTKYKNGLFETRRTRTFRFFMLRSESTSLLRSVEQESMKISKGNTTKIKGVKIKWYTNQKM